MTQEPSPDSAAPGGIATSTYSYNGLVTTSTNPKVKPKPALKTPKAKSPASKTTQAVSPTTATTR